MRHIPSALVTLLLAVGCASATGRVGAANSDRNIITAEEIRGSSAATAYDAVARLRPQFLHTRGTIVTGGMTSRNDAGSGTPGGTVQIAVYLDDNYLGSLDALKQIEVSSIQEIRYYNASDATTKWGTGNSAGAIQVVTRRQ